MKNGLKILQEKKTEKILFDERQSFLKQNSEYRHFLKKSMEFFRVDSQSKVDSLSMKVPKVIQRIEEKQLKQ